MALLRCARSPNQNNAGLVWCGSESGELSWELSRTVVGCAKVRVSGSAGHGHGLVFGGTASRTRSVVYLSSLIRSVIALHNLINNKLSNKEAERAVADDADKDKHKVRLDERTQQTGNCALVQHATCPASVEAVVAIRWPSAARMDALEVSALLRWRQIRYCGRCLSTECGHTGSSGLALFDAGEERGR